MRRTVVGSALALTLSASAVLAAPSTAVDEPGPVTAATGPALPDERAAERALDAAVAALDGDAPAAGVRSSERAVPEGQSATLALRDLALALPALGPADRARGRALLARPTQGERDPLGDGYTRPSVKRCTRTLCLHWVERGGDAPPGEAWVDRNLKVLKQVWRKEVGRLGYQRPLRDGNRGGGAKFDVYLKDVGSQGLYGYCAPEPRRGEWRSQGYCVLDNDYSRREFQAPPRESLRVTAAHEFFHAIQFGYDYAEDRWLMEGTATWVEERVYDAIDDNRQYLPYGQVARPAVPLDRFSPNGFSQYGNWAFFEYLSERFGTDVVRRAWANADGSWRNHSLKAVKAALPRKLSFRDVFRSYAAANTVPGRTYPEGRHWPRPPYAASHELGPGVTTAGGDARISHLAARHVRLRPRDDARARSWFARVTVDGPRRATAPAAQVLVHRPGGDVVAEPVALNRKGNGDVTFRFGASTATRATLTLANASTRYDCWQESWTWACQGTPRDDKLRFAYTVEMFRR
jgi:hypothetical protein